MSGHREGPHELHLVLGADRGKSSLRRCFRDVVGGKVQASTRHQRLDVESFGRKVSNRTDFRAAGIEQSLTIVLGEISGHRGSCKKSALLHQKLSTSCGVNMWKATFLLVLGLDAPGFSGQIKTNFRAVETQIRPTALPPGPYSRTFEVQGPSGGYLGRVNGY